MLRGRKETMRKSAEGEHRLRGRGTQRVSIKAIRPIEGKENEGLACCPCDVAPKLLASLLPLHVALWMLACACVWKLKLRYLKKLRYCKCKMKQHER